MLEGVHGGSVNKHLNYILLVAHRSSGQSVQRYTHSEGHPINKTALSLANSRRGQMAVIICVTSEYRKGEMPKD